MTGFGMATGCGSGAGVVGVCVGWGVMGVTVGVAIGGGAVTTGLLGVSCSTLSPFNIPTTALAAPAHKTMTGRVPATAFITAG